MYTTVLKCKQRQLLFAFFNKIMPYQKSQEITYIEQAHPEEWPEMLLRKFGGVITSNSYHVHTPNVKIDSRMFTEVNNISFVVTEMYVEEGLIVREMVDKEPMLIMRFVRHGSIQQLGHESSPIGAGQKHGACIYSTKHPLDLVIPAKQKIQILAVRTTVEHWLNITNRKLPEMYDLVNTSKPWIVYEPLSFLIDSDMERLFELQRSVNGIVGYSISRCLDISTHFILQLRRRVEMQKGIDLLEIDTFVLFQIKDELEQNVKQPPSMEALVEKYNMSASKLRNNFKKAFGLPPRRYVIQFRLQEAHKRIIHSDVPLTKVAEDLGFADLAHLSTRFKKEYNVTPSALREKREY